MKTFDEVYNEVASEMLFVSGAFELLETAKIAAIRYAELACEEQRKICRDTFNEYENDNEAEIEILNAPKPELK